jgi:hypothetical protein
MMDTTTYDIACIRMMQQVMVRLVFITLYISRNNAIQNRYKHSVPNEWIVKDNGTESE